MTERYTFSLAEQTDCAAVLAVYHACVGLPGCTWSYDYPSQETFDTDVANGWLYCLKEAGAIIAVVSLGAFNELAEDGIAWHSQTRNPCEIGRIGVLPNRRGRGLGAQLLSLAIDAARQQRFDAMRLLVSPQNPPAVALYRRAGFRTVGEIDKFDKHWFCQELLL